MGHCCDHEAFTPDELAEFDQDWAAVNHRLEQVIGTYQDVLSEAPDCLIGAKADLAGFIKMMTSHASCAELLACAIDRLHRASQR